jgi:hypothetical protein
LTLIASDHHSGAVRTRRIPSAGRAKPTGYWQPHWNLHSRLSERTPGIVTMEVRMATPDLDQLRKTARDLLRALQADDPLARKHVCAHLPRFAGSATNLGWPTRNSWWPANMGTRAGHSSKLLSRPEQLIVCPDPAAHTPGDARRWCAMRPGRQPRARRSTTCGRAAACLRSPAPEGLSHRSWAPGRAGAAAAPAALRVRAPSGPLRRWVPP